MIVMVVLTAVAAAVYFNVASAALISARFPTNEIVPAAVFKAL